ncbi:MULTISPECIES: Hsp20 family protein [unclassified Lentilitoribacter]|jgi:molecular chaperone IbpA|uniref:Hsp20 family protein n=1 Tax=unclassified Lentilitoribacter TaxID=2647570 RepID=UPI0013A68ECB|nr:Hsp20 family protein [Lentilitoribacter sp. Alg239-R112]
MRHVDFSPFYRSTVGFDRLFTMLDSLGQPEQQTTSYPPYNIERTSEDAYTITMAVAGFSEEDLDIEARENTLTIKGEKKDESEQNEEAKNVTYLHRGIATRAFERRFQLAEHVQIQGANLKNGLLHVELVREVPEDKKLRKIEIAGTNAKQTKAKQIESKKA